MSRNASCKAPRAFTLIELMIVIGIMAIVMAMGIPMIYHVFHREGMTKAVNETVEVLGTARRLAILQGAMTEVVFHPRELRLEVAGGGGGAKPSGNQTEDIAEPSAPAPSGSGLSAQLSSGITIQMLEINLVPFTDAEVARIRFYPNGTCDELTLILHSDQNEQ